MKAGSAFDLRAVLNAINLRGKVVKSCPTFFGTYFRVRNRNSFEKYATQPALFFGLMSEKINISK